MIQIREILIPTDFREPPAAAIGHAAMLAERFGARLTMLHVVTAREHNAVAAFPELDPACAAEEEAAEEEVAERLGLQPSQRLQVRRELRHNAHPAEEITRFAAEMQADLIVTGTHGRTGLSHLILGSLAEDLMRTANCPVLVARTAGPGASGEVMPYLQILAPIDFSPDSEKAMRYALALSQLFRAQLHILHVVDLPVYPAHYAVNHALAEEFSRDFITLSHEEIERWLTGFEQRPRHCQTHVQVGRPYHEIVKFAAAQDIDLIVMGTRGLSRLQEFFLGGNTARVIRHAPCPVLVVKLQERDFVH
ncbi:MAG: universal stress protein [candidate division KSB1 bacterium]|nr:universal stress protein [candidate division KSB1 bacterium]MDZ7274565.1 universal stress protein [candidate division KSB1 bacterium]MDZ7284774.1 universal stress protein [candidate division KSB1 bacterium]MDZ7297806.1 universal stress protein [candidate division KSB1 bacterium]MDZ7307770.1 universal stress protein [candidate division KSB1 bacterium]